VLHNADDFRTPIDQGLQYYAALRMAGKPAKLAVFPDSSHGMSRNGRPSHRVTRMELILDWFGRYTGTGSGAM
jgi:dipeptidyl aminopeptidase/acylaminoacyl peptidase